MNFDCEYFIRETQRKIAEFRNRATWLKIAGNIAAVVVVVTMVMALLQAILRGVYSFGRASAGGNHLDVL